MTETLSPILQPAVATAPTGYLPIEEHGVIGDLRTVALVGTEGTIDWYCPGRFDAPSVFGAILDKERGGYYRLAPAHDNWKSRQLYFPDTNVLITRFISEDGVAEVLDFMPLPKPGDGSAGRLIRTVLAIRGELPFRLELDPRFDYGRQGHEAHATEHGALMRSNGSALALSSRIPVEVQDGRITAEFTVKADERVSFVLETQADGTPPCPYAEDETRRLFTETVEYWRRWLRQCRYTGRWRETINRSALTLKLLTYEPTGAIVAAPTTSLPEQLGGPRNWDYRFTWIRDASFSLYALLRLGFTSEAEAFMGWLTDRVRDSTGRAAGPLQIMYGIDGRAELEELELD